MRSTIAPDLFLADDRVESMRGLRRTLHQPRKHFGNPLVRPHAPWIKNAFLFGSVIRESGRWRMWYHAEVDVGDISGADRFGRYAACYAESTDGLQWHYPDLDVFRHNGRGTNVVMHRDLFPGYGEIYSVVPQPPEYPGPDRYVGMFNLLWHREDISPLSAAATLTGLRRPDWYRSDWAHGGMMLARSPDGIHWTATYPYTLDYPADISHMLYDTRLGKFVIYGRKLTLPSLRTVQRLESQDLVCWDPPQTRQVFAADDGDPPGTQIYSMPVMAYGPQYVGFPQMYHAPSGILEFQLTTSRDGIHWTRVADRATWLPVGGPGDWDRFNNAMASAPVRVGDELWFYYSGRTCRHSGHRYRDGDNGPTWSAIGLATLRLDGFVSLDATFAPGSVTTVPVAVPENGALHLNVRSPFGMATAELLDPETHAVLARSDPVTVDAVDAPVTWAGAAVPPAGRPRARLRLNLVNAALYAYWWAPA